MQCDLYANFLGRSWYHKRFWITWVDDMRWWCTSPEMHILPSNTPCLYRVCIFELSYSIIILKYFRDSLLRLSLQWKVTLSPCMILQQKSTLNSPVTGIVENPLTRNGDVTHGDAHPRRVWNSESTVVCLAGDKLSLYRVCIFRLTSEIRCFSCLFNWK